MMEHTSPALREESVQEGNYLAISMQTPREGGAGTHTRIRAKNHSMQHQPPRTATVNRTRARGNTTDRFNTNFEAMIKPMNPPANSTQKHGQQFPRIGIRETLAQETHRPIWKHGTKLNQRFHTFEVDNELVDRHMPVMRELDQKIGDLLQQPQSNCDWQTLYTHPKLMSYYYWHD